MKLKKTISLFLTLSLLLGSVTFAHPAQIYAEESVREETAITDVFAENIPSVEIGDVRVQVLSGSLARIEEKGPNGYEDRTTYHIVNRENWPGAAATKITDANETEIVTENYTVVVPNAADSLDGVYIKDSRGKEIWRYQSLPSSSVYLPAPGATPKAWAIADNPRAVPAEWGYRPMPEDNTEFTDYNGWDTTNNAPDLFIFMPDGDAKQLRKDFTGLTGESDFIPLKSLGLWHSRYYAYSEESALDWIDQYRAHHFPLDFFVVDTDWRTGASLGYNVNTNLFPDMPRFIQRAHDKNVNIMFNDHPEPVKDNNGNRIQSLNPAEVKYRNDSLKSIFDMGMDVWWYDRNWSTSLVSPFPGVPKESFGMYLYQAITADYKYDTKGDAEYADRPLIMGNIDGIDNGVFNRPPDISSHRFSIQWTGDTHGQPSDLRQEIVDVVKSGALTSTPYISSDIAGHMDVLTPDLWTRWTQFAAFSPFIRYHCTAGANLDRSPWLYGTAAEDIARDYIDMRYRLLPVFYSLSHENYETGLPLLRRLDYNYPQYAEAQDDTQYTLGNNILVAPIWEASSSTLPVPAAWLSHNGEAGLFAEYFNNEDLSGSPVLSRTESTLNYNWGTGSPAAGVNTDHFSARYTGKITIGENDSKLAVMSDDGVRLWIDDELIVDNWQASDSVTTFTKALSAGTTHDIKAEYYEGSGNAVIRLQYVDTTKEGNARTVFIPDGRWIDTWTGEEFTGPETITVRHNSETSPIFVRSGSILPLAENVSYIGEKDWSTVGLDVYPSVKLTGASELYEDDGDSVAYRDGKFRKTALETSFNNGDVLVNIGAAVGDYDNGMNQRTWKIRVHAPESWGALLGATQNGVSVSPVAIEKSAAAMPFAIDGASRDADIYEITIAAASISSAQEVRLTFEHPVEETLPQPVGSPVDFEMTDAVSPYSVNLTATGAYDWAHFGTDGAWNKTVKANVAGRLIGSLSASEQAMLTVDSKYTEFSWADGEGANALRNGVTTGVSVSEGRFTLDVNVGREEEKITLYVGGDSASGTLSVSDGHSARIVGLSNLSGAYMRKIVINARADEDGVLQINYEKKSGAGNIAFFAASVSDPNADAETEITRFASIEQIPGNIDLSTGAIDWVHVGYGRGSGGVTASVNRKADANPLLSTPLLIGSSLFEVHDYNDGNNGSGGVAFSGGVTVSGEGPDGGTTAENHNAIATEGGFQISVPSTDQWQQLKVYLGCWNGSSQIEIFDDAGVEYTNFTLSGGSSAAAIRALNITFQSEEDTMLHIRESRTSNTGNVSLAGYALYALDESDVKASVSLESVAAGTLDFSDGKYIDWAHFGYQAADSVNRKQGVASSMIGTPSCILNQGLQNSNDFLTTFAWSDGTVNQNVTGTRDFAYSFDGMQFDLDAEPGTWQFSIYTSVWWAKGYVEFVDEDGNIIDIVKYESKTAATGTSEYRKINFVYSSDEAQTITVRNMPALAFDGHRGNMSFAAVTVESAIDHITVGQAEAPAINTDLTASVFASKDDSLAFINNDLVAFRWQKADEPDGTFTDIDGAETAVYRPTKADVGQYLRVLATYADKTVQFTLTVPVFGLVYKPVFKDFKGETLTALTTNLVNVTYKYYNAEEDGSDEVTMIVAVYSPEGKLQYAAHTTETIPYDTIGEFELSMTLPDDADENSTASVFVWDADDLPVTSAYHFPE